MARSSVCDGCGGNLVSITFEVRGQPRTMLSCSTCDRRVWLAGDRRTELADVLSELSGGRARRC